MAQTGDMTSRPHGTDRKALQTLLRNRTEYRYDSDAFKALANVPGLAVIDIWTAPDRLFSVQYLALRESAGRAKMGSRYMQCPEAA